MAIARPCLGCRRPTTRPRSRCASCSAGHQHERDQRRGSFIERGYDAEYQRNRAALLVDQPPCNRCGTPFGDPRNLMSADHLKPVSQGGTHDLDNLVPACRRCNSRRGARADR